MLTGIETAGIVLALLPIVITAVDLYHQGVKPMEEYWNYGPALQLLHGRLNFQATLYEDSIRRLLIASGVSADDIHILLDLVDEPWRVTEAWRKEDLSKRLQETLGPRHFDSFTFAVQQIEAVMKKLMAKLKLDVKGKPKWFPNDVSLPSTSNLPISHPQPRLEFEWRRISRSFSQGKQDRLIEEFKEYNNAIAAFVLNKEILALPNEGNNIIDTKSYVRYFDLVRREACSLYEHLEENWKCSCEDPHYVNLQLCFRGMDKPTLIFKVCFSSSTGEDSKTWRKTCIHPGPRNGSAQHSNEGILCNALCNISQQGQLNELLWASLDWQIKAEIEDPFIQTSTVLHLRSLLAGEQKRSKRDARFSGLSEKQRRQIAVALSYSVLQFYDSPWMHDLWGEEDIYFFTGVNKRKLLEISDPCFSRSFPLQHPRILASNDPLSAHFIDLYIPNKPLFALGIVLLELCLNMPFNDLHEISSIKAGHPDPLEKYRIVMENLDRAFDEWGDTFGQIVQKCLNPEFGLRPSEKRMDFDKFRCYVYEGIVAPLEEDLKLFI